MPRKRLTKTDPATLDQTPSALDAKPEIESGEGRKKPVRSNRMAGRKSTTMRTPAEEKNPVTVPIPAPIEVPQLAEPASTPIIPAKRAEIAKPEIQTSDKEILSHALSIQERIALLAYSYWEARGRQGGSPEEDWFRAEREIVDQLGLTIQR